MSKKNTTTAMLAASLTGDSEAAARVAANQAETRFVRTLIDMRVEKKFSQRGIAKKMGVGPSKVCRMEACNDKELNLGDVMLYSKALGVNMSVRLATATRNCPVRCPFTWTARTLLLNRRLKKKAAQAFVRKRVNRYSPILGSAFTIFMVSRLRPTMRLSRSMM